VRWFHDSLLLPIIVAISVFVLALLIWVMMKYREKANPTPSKVTHNTMIEVLWTVIPILILVVIAVPSFRILYLADKAPSETTVTIKARGHQWYWSYVYESVYQVGEPVTLTERDGKTPRKNRDGTEAKVRKPVLQNGKPVEMLKDGKFVFDSRIACRDYGKPDEKKKCDDYEKAVGRKPVRLLDVDNEVVIPVGEYVRVLVAGMDVIHAWTVPAMGVKTDANPGRINEVWIYAKAPGLYYGMCSELCGADHGFMPIAVRAVPRPDFEKWLADAQKKFDKLEEPAKRADAPAPGRATAERR
jgi:cytochrome c oxidase subunit 2